MAGTAYISSTTLGTIYLQDSANGLDITYTPMAAEPDAYFVTEPMQLRVRKSAIADVRNVVGSITRQFEMARRYNNFDGGEKVYFNYQPAGYTSAYRTEIIDASIVPQYGITDAPIWEASGTKTIMFDINWTRRNYFEGAETILTIYNPNGTAGTIGIDPHFNDGSGAGTAKKYNYVSIAGTSITGDLPCKTKITISTANERLKRVGIWAGYDGTITATSFTDYSGSAAAAGECNGTAYGALATTKTFTHSGTLSHYGGYAYELVARVKHHTSAGTTLSLWAYQSGGGTIAYDKVYASLGTAYWSIVPLGIMNVPDTYVNDPSVTVLGLGIFCEGTIDWDCSWLLPVSSKMVAEAEQSAVKFVINQLDEEYYGQVSSSTSCLLEPFGELRLFPGKDTRLHFLNSNVMSVGTIDTYAVTVSYRPRRLTI